MAKGGGKGPSKQYNLELMFCNCYSTEKNSIRPLPFPIKV